jgi:short-subunit dehydrogenase
METFSDALWMELAPRGIHVSVVEPDTVATAMPMKLLQDASTVLGNLPAEGRDTRQAGEGSGQPVSDKIRKVCNFSFA